MLATREADTWGAMQAQHDDRSSPSTRNSPRAARGPDPRKIVDLEAGPVTGLHSIAYDLQGPPAWRLWLTVAILGTTTALALMVA